MEKHEADLETDEGTRPTGRDAKSGRYICAIFLPGANLWAILGHFVPILEILGYLG